MRFSDQFIDQVRLANDIVDVIGGAIPLKRNGANWVALCPFHKEKSPSFNVHPERQIFHCFGCHKGGNVFKFITDYENISFPEAVVRLAERAKIPIEDGGGEDNVRRGQKEQLLKLHEAITQRWQRCLANEEGGRIAREYLEKRGLSGDAVRQFRIGAAPEAWDDTVNWAAAQGFDPKLVEDAGLVIRKEGTDRRYDRFRGRLMFPICDEQGRVIAFSGRVLQGDEKTAKYVNSPETPIFKKGRVLFALDKAKRAILEEGRAIVCEGQIDTIACHMAGVRNVVAPQGTALTAEHSRIIRRYVEEVVLCFDGDKAGRNAAIRSLDDLLGSDLAIRVVSIPPPEDPDSFIRKNGADAFRELIRNARGYFDFLLDHLLETNGTQSDRARLAVVREMASAVRKTGNEVLIDTYAQRTAQRLGVGAGSVRSEFQKPGRERPGPTDEEPVEIQVESPSASVPPLEVWILRYVLHAPDLMAFAAAHLDPAWISHDLVRQVLGRLFESPGSVSDLLARFDGDEAAQSLITESATIAGQLPDPDRQLMDVLIRLRNQHCDREIASLTARMAGPPLEDGELREMLQRQTSLRLRKKEPLQLLE